MKTDVYNLNSERNGKRLKDVKNAVFPAGVAIILILS